jgi:hypothetical protein
LSKSSTRGTWTGRAEERRGAVDTSSGRISPHPASIGILFIKKKKKKKGGLLCLYLIGLVRFCLPCSNGPLAPLRIYCAVFKIFVKKKKKKKKTTLLSCPAWHHGTETGCAGVTQIVMQGVQGGVVMERKKE